MKAERIAYLSALLGSTCCAVPLGLAVIGLGSLGVGSWIGPYHWYFTGAAGLLLVISWGYFVRERRRAEACSYEITNARATRRSLMAASGVVAAFLALNLSTALSGTKEPLASSAGATELITVPVQGMSCVACEYPIESNLAKIDGVLEANASAAAGTVSVKTTPGTVTLEAIAGAVRSAGYEAEVSAARREQLGTSSHGKEMDQS